MRAERMDHEALRLVQIQSEKVGQKMQKSCEIILVIAKLGGGGAERVVSELANAWVEAGFHVSVATWMNGSEEEYPLSDQVERINIGCEKRSRIARRLGKIVALWRVLRERRDACVVGFLPTSFFLIGVVSPFVRVKVILSERCDPRRSSEEWWQRLGRRIFFRQADLCVFQTEEAMRCFPSGIQKKGVVIPNPINPALPEAFVGQRRKVVVTACRLTAQKNLRMLIDAFERFLQEFPEYTLEIYGEGEEEEALRRRIRELHLEKEVKLMGFSRQIYEKMLDCSMYVMSSDYEGISNSMMEALGLGLPTIATDCPVGGARMVIQDGENGILIPVGDVDALYQAMKRIANNPDFAEKLSKNSRRVREVYDVRKIAREWLDQMLCIGDKE